MNQTIHFFKQPYNAYHNREVPQEDVELTHVGPTTSAGEYMRRFWQPVFFSAQLKSLPQRIKILGEELVLFRTGKGDVGALQLYCPHRGASLEYGISCDKGLRCSYHGWLFGVDGAILERPAEGDGASCGLERHHGAYPVVEYKGLIFLYMGPPEQKPEFPLYDTLERPGFTFEPTSWMWQCNWLQLRENAMDPSHTYFLHTTSSGVQFTDDFAELPEHQYFETPNGMVYDATRRTGDLVWVRICEVLHPNIHQLPSNWNKSAEPNTPVLPFLFDWSVPIDDTHTLVIGWFVEPEGSEGVGKKFLEAVPGQMPNRSYQARQSNPGDYEAQVLGRPISVHKLEYLASNDQGVVMFRRMVRRAIRAQGASPVPGSGLISTCARDVYIEAEPAETKELDRALLRKVGEEVFRATLPQV